MKKLTPEQGQWLRDRITTLLAKDYPMVKDRIIDELLFACLFSPCFQAIRELTALEVYRDAMKDEVGDDEAEAADA